MSASKAPTQDLNIKAFLGASSKYFEIDKDESVASQRNMALSAFSWRQGNHVFSYRHLIQTLLLATGLSAFAATPVLAEPGCDHMRDRSERHAKMLDQGHKQLHDALTLTAEQEPVWKLLIESEQPKSAAQGGQAEDWVKLNAPERAEKILEISQARQAQIADYVTALKAFYVVLTPEQQNIFEGFHYGPRAGMASKTGSRGYVSSKVPGKP